MQGLTKRPVEWRRRMGASAIGDSRRARSGNGETGLTRRELFALSAVGLVAGAPSLAQAAAPQGQLTWGVHVTLAPTWFDPAETPGVITPFMIMYALHDAMLKPMPGNPQ